MKKLWDLKNVFSNLELEGQGHGIIMGVTRLLLLGPFYSMQTNFFAHDSNPLKNQNGTNLCQVIFLTLFGLFTKPEDPMSFVWGGRPLPAGSDVMNEGCSGIHIHTVAIWTFTFHKISGFVSVILKANFKQLSSAFLPNSWRIPKKFRSNVIFPVWNRL